MSSGGGGGAGGAAPTCSDLAFLESACASCVQASCCGEVGACEADGNCLTCLFDVDAICPTSVQAHADAARTCMFDACRSECGMSDAVCTDTAAESCTLPPDLLCNPFTNEGCAATEICAFDVVSGGPATVSCYDPGVALDEPCGACSGNCPAGFICTGPTPQLSVCAEYCCSDSDCAPGAICDRSFDFEYLFGLPGLGQCSLTTPAPAGDSCAAPIVVAVGSTVAGNTTDAPATYDSSCGDPGAREIVYSVTPTQNGTLKITMQPGLGFSVDALLHVRTSCADVETELGCADFSGDPHHAEMLQLEATAGTTYFVFADGWAHDTFGPFELTVEML